MSFSPDRTLNLPPRACPSSNNHARHRLRLPLGAAAARCRQAPRHRLIHLPADPRLRFKLPQTVSHLFGTSGKTRGVCFGSSLCENACCFRSMTRLWIWMTGFLDLGISGTGADLWVGFRFPCVDVTGGGHKWVPTSPYAALIAAISGAMPIICMTRLRL